MKKLLSLVFSGLLLVAPAYATSVTTTGAGVASGGGGGAYTGPLDVFSTGVVAFWGVRAPNASQASAHVAALNICNGASCGDVHLVTAGGLNATDVAANGCNSVNTCTVQTIYDTSGALQCTGSTACNLTQSTGASRATYTNSCVGGKPCLVFGGSAIYTFTNAPAVNQPFSVSYYGERTGATSSYNDVIQSDGGGQQIGFSATSNNVFTYAGSTVDNASATDNAYHSVQTLTDRTSTQIWVDGTSGGTLADPGTGALDGGNGAVGGGGSGSMNGNLTEIIWYNATFTGTTATNLTTNQTGYY